MIVVEVSSPSSRHIVSHLVANPAPAPVEVRGRKQITALGRQEERDRVLANAVMGMRGACALWTLMPRRRPDMTAGVKPTRFFPTRRAIAACCSLTGLVGAVLVFALPTGTSAAPKVQASVVRQVPALAVLASGKLTLVVKGTSAAIGPIHLSGTVKSMIVTDFQWSAGGRYLAWEQSNPNTGQGGIVWYDTVTHRRMSWPIQVQYSGGWSVSSSGLALLVAGEDLGSPSTLISYNVVGPVRHRLVVVPISDNVVGYSGGFIMGPDIKTGTQLWRVSLSGAVTKLQALPKPASNGPPYEVTAVSPDGKVFAAELGDHTDGCGVGPVSRIFVVNETTGTVSQAFLPAGPRWRVQSFVFDPKDTLDATMVDCTQASTMRTTVFWVARRGVLTGEKSGALVATEAGGVLAYQPGHIKLGGTEAPILEEVATRPLTVNGRPLASITTAATVSWAP
jgi:hypothetical protein